MTDSSVTSSARSTKAKLPFDAAELTAMAKGKYADELDIPVSDEEGDCLAEADTP